MTREASLLEAERTAREVLAPDLSGNQHGVGRGLFTLSGNIPPSVEADACALFDKPDPCRLLPENPMPMSLAHHAPRLDALFDRAPVLPVLVIEDLAQAVPLARALVAGGLPVLEITLRTPVALAAIARIAAEVEGALPGAGTVLAASDFAAVMAAGGSFAISPGATPALRKAAETAALPWLPGVATASELMQGLECGQRHFKFFPASSAGGAAALRAFAGPFPQVRFCPTGGLDAGSAADLLALPNVACVGGSWMLPQAAIARGDWARIEALAREAAALRIR